MELIYKLFTNCFVVPILLREIKFVGNNIDRIKKKLSLF